MDEMNKTEKVYTS